MESSPFNKFIFLNGPPESGKDFIGLHLKSSIEDKGFDVRMERFAKPIKDGLKAMYSLTDEEAEYYLNTHEGKSKSHARLLGQNGRQVQIDFSEKYMKPTFGDDVFGKLFVARQHTITRPTVTVVTDSGFCGELNAHLRHFKQVESYLFRIHREGKTFAGDSRSYLNEADIDPIFYADMDNNRDISIVTEDILNQCQIF